MYDYMQLCATSCFLHCDYPTPTFLRLIRTPSHPLPLIIAPHDASFLYLFREHICLIPHETIDAIRDHVSRVPKIRWVIRVRSLHVPTHVQTAVHV